MDLNPVLGCWVLGKVKSQRFNLSLRIPGDLLKVKYPDTWHPSNDKMDSIKDATSTTSTSARRSPRREN